MGVRIRYFAAAKAALGRASDERAAGTTIADLLSELAAEASAEAATGSGAASGSGAGTDAATIERILARCTFIHNRTATADRTIVLADGDTLDVLPPFAGG
ncbi:MoaD/ThiS family protein [Herbiconiux sp. CPCC 203407]|uniref:MoaD/ThiS family protein n=1 Tax=Herbiconiux oxytropis TaxID=2970915 RepID=A0AA41XJU9_9MICO|nr:MoaD/ThiS family protein [Herbiconiux oxytropis]MCS5722482.1 MoaD/ThiS family protein [Herbiconiux oxytropis]MCS5727585.1 MoaD/ThiS family protein [Herbiconiux oxytropis]